MPLGGGSFWAKRTPPKHELAVRIRQLNGRSFEIQVFRKYFLKECHSGSGSNRKWRRSRGPGPLQWQ